MVLNDGCRELLSILTVLKVYFLTDTKTNALRERHVRRYFQSQFLVPAAGFELAT